MHVYISCLFNLLLLAIIAVLKNFCQRRDEKKKTTEELIDDFNPFAVDQFANQPAAASQVCG